MTKIKGIADESFSRSTFGCKTDSVTYDLEREIGHVHMPAMNYTDMDMTIAFFTQQIPDIAHIITWCDGQLDTQYVRIDGQWTSI